jgi:hypothetical protein
MWSMLDETRVAVQFIEVQTEQIKPTPQVDLYRPGLSKGKVLPVRN